MTGDAGLVELLTALADDELVLGHRHSEWTGFAPHLEEDVAFASIAQDEIGHAAAFYALVAQLTGDDRDRLALGRDHTEYRNAIICERPNRDWAYTLARHWLYDTADARRLEALERSSNEDVAALATKIRREERYHLIHAESWMRRVAGGPVEGRTRLIDAMALAYPEAVGIFEPVEHEDELVERGVLPVASEQMKIAFLDDVRTSLDRLGLPTQGQGHTADAAEFVASSSGDLISQDAASQEPHEASSNGIGGRSGTHTDDLRRLWEDMTTQYRSNPGATW